MTKDVSEMRERIVTLLKAHLGDLQVVADTPEKFEVKGTVEAMQGKTKVDGFYFSTVVPKPKDVRFYFFPTYTHKEQLGELSPQLQKCLKGKSCFHIKQMDDELEAQLKQLIAQAVILYKQDGLL